MRASCLLLALFGSLCTGLQPGLEYHYRYTGRVATGIIDVRHQFAAAGIKADITIQMTDSASAIVEFSDVQVGDYHDEFRCDIKSSLPIEYHALEHHHSDLLEKPFRVVLNGSGVFEFLEVPEEPAWITNIRKAVVNIFRISPFGLVHHDIGEVSPEAETGEFHAPGDDASSHSHHDLDFSAFEETIAGRCTSWYSVLRIPEEESAIYERDNELEVDEQREESTSSEGYTGAKGHGKGAKGAKGAKGRKGGTSKTHRGKTSKTPARYTSNVPQLPNTLWNVQRTIDFDHCESLVSMKSHVNHFTEDLLTRGSTGSYVIRGDSPSSMRIEQARIEGMITLHTQENHQDHFDTFTNQTLELTVVRKLEEQITIDYSPIRFYSWSYEVEHAIADHPDHGIQQSLERILTGAPLTEEMLTEAKNIVITLIDAITDHTFTNTPRAETLVRRMSRITEAVAILSYDHLKELYDHFTSEDSSIADRKVTIFLQTMAIAGAEPAVTLFLENILNSDFLIRHVYSVNSFFKNIPRLIKSPSVIPKFMEVVMQIEWDDIGLIKSQGLMEFSTLASQMCLHSERRSTHWDNTCEPEHVCDTSAIINTYIPYLQTRLNDESVPWRRHIYLEALKRLGTPLAIDILKPYIIGAKEVNPIFRKEAIAALSKKHMPDTAMGQIISLLMPIFDNIAEPQEIRSVAFLTMASWEISVSWWHRMALATWHDPSSKLANFISTTIKSTADSNALGKLSKMASRVVHLIKPASPSSMTHSVNLYFLEYLNFGESSRTFSLAWLANMESIIPSEIYFRILSTTYLGFSEYEEVSLQQYHKGKTLIYAFMKKQLSKGGSEVSQDVIDIVKGMYEEIKENLNIELPHEPESDLEIVYAMISEGLIFDYRVNGGGNAIKLPFSESQFNRLREAYVALPTDLGLPFIAKYTLEYAYWARQNNRQRNSGFIVEGSMDLFVETKTLIPWSEKFAIASGYSEQHSVFLPLAVKLGADRTTINYQMTLEPYNDNKVNLVDVSSTPFTAQRGSFPTTLHQMDNDVKAVRMYNGYLHESKTDLLSTVGISAVIEWKANTKRPNVWDIITHPFSGQLHSMQEIEMHLLYDPVASTTKSVTTSVTYVSTEKKSTEGKTSEDIESLGQESQDYSDYSQFSQSSSSDYSQFSQSASGGQEFEDADQFQQETSPTRQRIAKIQQQVTPVSGGNVRSIALGFTLHGSPTKNYEALFTWVFGTTTHRRTTKFQLAWIKDVPEGTLGEPHSTCLNVQVDKPKILHFTGLEDFLKTNFHSTITANLHEGVNCDSSPVLQIEGSMDVSDDQLNEARRKLTEDCGDDHLLHPIDLITSPIYDQMKFNAHWTEALPMYVKNFTYHTYDLLRGFKFPEVYYDYTVTNADHQMDIDATKSLKTQLWDIHLTKPHEVSIVENQKTPYIFDLIASPGSLKQTLVYDIFNGREHKACVITHGKVTTYDGLEYPYHPDECWNVLGMDMDGLEIGVGQVRFSEGQWEARLLLQQHGLLFEMTRSTLKVNGEDFKGHDDRFDVVFFEDGLLLTFHFLTDIAIKIDDNVYILEDHLFRSMVGGLCGNYDGEKSGDMVGPKGCVYSDPALFVNSWTTSGPGCSGFSYLSKMKPVKTYQDACPHHPTHVATGITYPEFVSENYCTTWIYEEYNARTLKCRALTPTPVCNSDCHGVHITTRNIQYDCYETDPAKHTYPRCFLQKRDTLMAGNCVHN